MRFRPCCAAADLSPAGLLSATVLTGNVQDFDYLNQFVPSVRVIFYRPVTGSRPPV
ncbi:hypothetical protein [Mesorhizobium sp. M0276]|uniref:hypothetical protein n=1 Tax=Mesorhizobium sp. M0276 TaxID=2956928 RepID=UPI003336050A